MVSLKRLKITQGSIRSLNGIENLKNLETLFLYGARNLTSLEALIKSKSIKNLVIESYGKVVDWDFLADMQQLVHVKLYKASSVKFIENLPNLLYFTCNTVLEKDKKFQIEQEIARNQKRVGLGSSGVAPAYETLVTVF